MIQAKFYRRDGSSFYRTVPEIKDSYRFRTLPPFRETVRRMAIDIEDIALAGKMGIVFEPEIPRSAAIGIIDTFYLTNTDRTTFAVYRQD